MDRKYKIEFTQYNEQNIQVISNCNAITFINNGATLPIIINNVLEIPVGGSIAIEGNENEIDTTTYNVVVKETCIVLRKLFL
jgi:Na+-transporting NADH:ubiquinone oxidoreductase subunit NqrF